MRQCPAPRRQRNSDPQPPRSSAPADPRATFGGVGAFGSGDAPSKWNPFGEGNERDGGAAPHGPFYDK